VLDSIDRDSRFPRAKALALAEEHGVKDLVELHIAANHLTSHQLKADDRAAWVQAVKAYYNGYYTKANVRDMSRRGIRAEKTD
jgi:hypothetical protein